jgi:large subunit ribosomal protein L21
MQSYLRLIQRSGGIRRKLSVVTIPDGAAAAASASLTPRTNVSLASRFSSTDASAYSFPTTPSPYAVVDHSEVYEAAMQGAHGKQLALARLEGLGKDDSPFDPFVEAELAALELQNDDDDEYGDDVVEAEYVDDDDDDADYDDEDDDDELDDMYNRDGTVRRQKSVLATLRAGFPAGGLFAAIALGGSQHKVTKDDLLVVNRLQPVEHYKIGSVHTLTDVMLVGSSHMTLVGMPFVAGAEVDLMVEEITRDSKVIIFKKRRRKHSERKNGFRRDVTLLRVLDVRMPEEYKDHNHVGREMVDELEDRSAVQMTQANETTVNAKKLHNGASTASNLGDPGNGGISKEAEYGSASESSKEDADERKDETAPASDDQKR